MKTSNPLLHLIYAEAFQYFKAGGTLGIIIIIIIIITKQTNSVAFSLQANYGY
jgi:hypothetical protein